MKIKKLEVFPGSIDKFVSIIYDRSRSGGKGAVYFLCDFEHKVVKIGFTTEPLERFNALKANYPFELKPICIVPYATTKIERYFHGFCRNLKLRGEWFKFDKNIESLVKKIKVQFKDDIEAYNRFYAINHTSSFNKNKTEEDLQKELDNMMKMTL